MSAFAETIETIEAEAASTRALFEGDTPVANHIRGPKYMANLAEAANFIADIQDGRKPMYHLREAMSTSDFPTLFADVLDRQLVANYTELTPVWQNYIKRSVVSDFRPAKRTAVDGAEGALEEVKELAEYPDAELVEAQDTLTVKKYGRKIDLSWEALINDDLDAFRDLPAKLARGARRTEQRLATQLYVDANGPHASLYTGGNANIVSGNPVLSIASLQTAFATLAAQKDEDGEPIVIEGVELVVPAGLEVTARNIVNATMIDAAEAGGTANQKIRATNWMASRVRISVDPYIPSIASSANGSTSWFLFANPNTGRAALELGFLRGHEQPALYERISNARRVGGGGDATESFDDDSKAWRVRHVLGGARLLNTGGYRATVASNGSGS